MEVTEYYGVCLAAVLAFLLVPLLFFVAGWLRDHIGHELNCLLNPLLPTWISGQALISRYEAALFCCLLAVNTLYVSVGNDDIDEAARRLGRVALINLIPISGGAHMNHIVSICGIHHDRYFRFHACLGAVFAVEVALHTILALRHWSISDIAGLLVSFQSYSRPLLIRLRHHVLWGPLLSPRSFFTGYSRSPPTSTHSWLRQLWWRYGFIFPRLRSTRDPVCIFCFAQSSLFPPSSSDS